MVTIFKYIAYISTFLWLFPPFKNCRTKYFYFFLVFALADPAALVTYLFRLGDPSKYHFTAAYLVVISLIDRDLLKRYYLYFIAVLILVLAIAYASPTQVLFSLMVPLYFTAVILLLKELVLNLRESSIKIFNLLIFLYMTSLFMKLIMLLLEVNLGVAYFYFTSVFTFLLAIYFTFTNVETSSRIRLGFREKYS